MHSHGDVHEQGVMSVWMSVLTSGTRNDFSGTEMLGWSSLSSKISFSMYLLSKSWRFDLAEGCIAPR